MYNLYNSLVPGTYELACTQCVFCVYVIIPFILDDRPVDAPAGITREEGHTVF